MRSGVPVHGWWVPELRRARGGCAAEPVLCWLKASSTLYRFQVAYFQIKHVQHLTEHPGYEWTVEKFAKLRENCLCKKRDIQVLPVVPVLSKSFSLQLFYACANVHE